MKQSKKININFVFKPEITNEGSMNWTQINLIELNHVIGFN